MEAPEHNEMSTERVKLSAQKRHGTMTPDDLKAWQAYMRFTYDTASKALGVGRRTYAEWIAGTARIPGPVTLACNALAKGIGPWQKPINQDKT